MKRVAIFASGNGSNAENIITYFKLNSTIKISVLFSNNSNAKVLERAKLKYVPTVLFNKNELKNGTVFKELKSRKISFITLAGFLLKIPDEIINYYSNKIINIHPSLLPLYGGKGMYGKYVHQKVFEAKDKESGITIHFVNKTYDDGLIIFKAKCLLPRNAKINTIQKEVKKLELKFYPIIIENLLNEKN